MCAILAGDPFRLRIEEIKRLTPYQVQAIYNADRDDKGCVILESHGNDKQSPREFHDRVYAGMGLSREWIEWKWQDMQAKKAKAANG